MFLRRQELIDQFDSVFREDGDGGVLYWPKKSEIGLPIEWEEYAAVKAAFERVHQQNMAVTFLAFGAAGLNGFYKLLSENTYLPFLIGVGLASLFTFALHLRDGLGLLLPFIVRLDELKKSGAAPKFHTDPH